LFGARLAPLANVTLLGSWPEQVQAIRQNGLTLIEPDGRSRQQSIHATHLPAEIPPADIVLIAVKSHQTEQAARQAQQILAPNGLVLTLQNGIGNLETITAVITQNPVTLGTTSEGATIVEPGIVRHAGWGHTYLTQTAETAVRIQKIAALFRQAGFQTEITNNVESLIWGKLAVNAGINPLTALLRVPNGFLAENAAAREVMQAAANEVAQVAAAQGIQLPFTDAGQQALAVAQSTAANHSSMLQDVLRGAPTEIDVICGAVVKYGRLHNIPTPINEQLWTAVKTNSPFTIQKEAPCSSPIQ
jgi:2-dehydropantoate 2-reductase